LSLSLSAQQTIDILQLSGRYGIPKDFTDDNYTGKVTEWGSVNSFTAGVKLARNSMLAVNLNHFYFNIQGDPDPEFPQGMAHPVSVNGFILRTGLIQKFKEGRSIQILVAPRLMSDFKNMDGNSFMMGGVLSYERKHSVALILGFGAIYNTELFGPYLVPFLKLDWQVAERWRINGMIPITARVEYKVNNNLTAGFNHFGLITTYALGNEAYQGDYLERQSIDLSLFARQRIAGNIFVEGMVGRALGRKYRQFEGAQKVDFAIPLITFGDERVVKNEVAQFDSGLILTLKLVYNMPVPE
jgi:hypothetical protein